MRVVIARTLIVLAASFASGVAPGRETARSDQGEDPDNVSLVQVIANPRSYDGKRIRVVGFCHLEFEGNALYIHREDFEQLLLKNAVWLDVERTPERSLLNDRYVSVEGTFDAEHQGHLSLFSGALTAVTRMNRHPTRAELVGTKP
jgi:hypothetical protein